MAAPAWPTPIVVRRLSITGDVGGRHSGAPVDRRRLLVRGGPSIEEFATRLAAGTDRLRPLSPKWRSESFDFDAAATASSSLSGMDREVFRVARPGSPAVIKAAPGASDVSADESSRERATCSQSGNGVDELQVMTVVGERGRVPAELRRGDDRRTSLHDASAGSAWKRPGRAGTASIGPIDVYGSDGPKVRSRGTQPY